jgi:hypothetical protein
MLMQKLRHVVIFKKESTNRNNFGFVDSQVSV